MPENLHEIASPASEYEQMPAMGIAPQRLLHDERKARKALAHVRAARHQPDARVARNRNHRCVSAFTTPASAAPSTSAPTTIFSPPASVISMRPLAPADAAAIGGGGKDAIR